MITNAEREQFKIYNIKEKQKDDLETPSLARESFSPLAK